MKQEKSAKVKKVASTSRGAFVDPIEGTQLAIDKVQAQEFLEDLQERNQKMTLCQFIVMLTADSFDELQQNTEALEIILRKYQIESVVKGSIADESGFSENDPVEVKNINFDKENTTLYTEVYAKNKKKGYLDINVGIAAPLDSPNYF